MNKSTFKTVAALFIGTITFLMGVATVRVMSNAFLKSSEPVPSAVTPSVYIDRGELAPASVADEPFDPNDLGCWGEESDHPRFGPISLSRDLVLTTICGTLFVRDHQGEFVWSYTTAPLTDEPKLIDGELVVIGLDLVRSGLDPNTGDRLWKSDTNGRAVYAQTEPYGRDMYVLLTDMSGYENGYTCERPELQRCPRTEPDRFSLFRKDKAIHHWTVPAGSRIEVKGRRIFATYRRGKRLKRIELPVPRKLTFRNSDEK